MAELDALDPIPEEVKLESGMVIEFERLKSRQFFKLLRIVTNGALPQLATAGLFDGGMSDGDFTAQFVTVVLMSIPEAEDQTIDFLRSMARPAGLRSGRKATAEDQQYNDTLWARFDEELENPELGDLVSVIEAIVKREASDIQALGKRLASMFKLAQKTGQIPTSKDPSPSLPKESTAASSEDSAESSISSPANTAGTTRRSSTSRSRASASASRPSKSAASSNGGRGSNG